MVDPLEPINHTQCRPGDGIFANLSNADVETGKWVLSLFADSSSRVDASRDDSTSSQSHTIYGLSDCSSTDETSTEASLRLSDSSPQASASQDDPTSSQSLTLSGLSDCSSTDVETGTEASLRLSDSSPQASAPQDDPASAQSQILQYLKALSRSYQSAADGLAKLATDALATEVLRGCNETVSWELRKLIILAQRLDSILQPVQAQRAQTVTTHQHVPAASKVDTHVLPPGMHYTYWKDVRPLIMLLVCPSTTSNFEKLIVILEFLDEKENVVYTEEIELTQTGTNVLTNLKRKSEKGKAFQKVQVAQFLNDLLLVKLDLSLRSPPKALPASKASEAGRPCKISFAGVTPQGATKSLLKDYPMVFKIRPSNPNKPSKPDSSKVDIDYERKLKKYYANKKAYDEKVDAIFAEARKHQLDCKLKFPGTPHHLFGFKEEKIGVKSTSSTPKRKQRVEPEFPAPKRSRRAISTQ
ncbi:Hypothetical Protein FCC1311_070512 [Hondaea fermentalgiana]|uniref:Uncharacterized protein n=1 Tax=Hondaea fermentalgiana TaxID=2315210 RepID=A0A2R5GR51_9STRA|nr:Hypothetical Protein FCC1311_070512 [Hondaea fermentalgiana]|eukprot:GBG30831.1 Hypothetical Protein FCC1311_070512 [Hondaea fermentalgiana]